MLASMTAREFVEWRAYADLEPFEEERGDLRTADIVSTLLNLHRPKGKPRVKLRDCVLRYGAAQAPETPPDPAEARKKIRAALNIVRAVQNTKKQQPRNRGARLKR